MALSTPMPPDPFSHRGTDGETFPQTSHSQQEVHWQITLQLREQRLMLQEKRRFLAKYRLGFHDEKVRVRPFRQGHWPPPTASDEQSFQAHLQHQQESFHTYQLCIQDKLRLLQEKKKALQDLPDRTQRQQAFRQLQVEWQEVRQGLREQRLILREQRTIYHERQLNYAAQLEQLRAEKHIRRQRQHERRW